MTTLNKMIYQIYEALQISVDDTSLDKRLIVDLINQNSELWIRRENKKNKSIDPKLIQDLKCVELELVDNSTCCEITTDCKILRPVQKLPNPVEFHSDKAITRVSSINIMSIPIIFMDYDHAIYFGNGRYNTKSLGAFLKNGYLYIIANKSMKDLLIETVNVQGVFVDPLDAARFTDCDGQSCFSWDSEYPLNPWMWQSLVKPNVLEEAKTKRTLYKDENNNSKDDAIPSINVNFTNAGTGVGKSKPDEEE